MDYRARIVAGTALALIMSAPVAFAAPLPANALEADSAFRILADTTKADQPLLLAQAETDESDEEEEERRRRREAEEERQSEDEPTAAEPIPGQPEQPPAQPPATEAPPPPQTEAPRPPSQGEQPPAQPPAGGAEPIPGAPEQPPAQPPATEAPRPPAQGEQPPAQPPAGGAEPIPGAPEQPPAQPPATEAPPPQTEAPRPPAQGEQPPAQPPAGGAEPIPGAPEQPPAQPPATEAPPPQTEAPRPPAQGEQPPAQPPAGGAEPIPGQPPAGGGAQPPANQPPANQPPAAQPPSAPGGVEPVQQEGEAPVLDSQKEDAAAGEPAPSAPAAEAAPPPASDEEAREAAQPAEVFSAREEQGQRVERRRERRERRESEDVVREIGDRIVIQLNNQIIVESDDRERMGRDASEVYYEDLPRGRVRETIVRPNGVQVVTIRNRYGDVIQRSRIMPDGREYFLVYADDRREGPREWRDPAADLPPLVLTIPASEYILDAGRVQDPDVYYRFLDQPPVERVQRLYTIDEVKYSARVRDSVRRIDLDTITFEFGSASIAESEIRRLEGVAIAMERMLEENPAETFLIEGHTDAVGSEVANLALSDRRAESVAAALTNVFGIPPENLVTQGYGERYLKIRTEEPERENRRVAMRRITPLVAPMASSQ